jgi:L-threonylcarbamoyladenylate synthase
LTAADAVRELGDAVNLAVDSGPAPGGTVSTVVKIENEKVTVLREGAIPAETIYNSMERSAHRKTVCSSSPVEH